MSTTVIWKPEVFDTSYQFYDKEIRCNHGKPWAYSHVETLRRLAFRRASLQEMCVTLGRSCAGVIPQLLKHGLIGRDETCDVVKYYYLDAPVTGLKHSDNEFYPLPDTDNRSVIPQSTTSTKTESNSMNTALPAIQVKTKTFIHGQDAMSLTDDQIFDLIAKKEADIAALRNIKAVSLKLTARIGAIENDISALVAFVDARPETPCQKSA